MNLSQRALYAPPVERNARAANGLRGHDARVAQGMLSNARKPRVVVDGRKFQAVEASQPVAFGERPPGACSWPISLGQELDFLCCGAPAPDGPYCPPHDRLSRDAGATRHVDAQIRKIRKRGIS
jgi:hypothetical protein